MYVKLFGTILDSSIWMEDLPTKVLWITMLAMADEYGMVEAATPALARRAGITMPECKKALGVLEGPDLESKSPAYGGRRCEKVDGGWFLLNYEKYREMRSKKQIADAARQARKRKRDRSVTGVTGHDVTVEAEAEAEAELPSLETSKGESSTSVTVLAKPDTVPWINQALATIKDSDFEDHSLLWEGRTVFSFWVWRRNKFLHRDPSEPELAKVIFTKDRKTRVNKWLIVYGLEDCLLAVEGLFHHQDMQQKDGTSYTEFENVFRPQGGGTIEKLRDEGIRHRKPVDKLLERLREQGWHE